MSEAFARRLHTDVRSRMLPVGFIALIDRFRLEGHRCIPVAISGHFSAPVYVGDRLVLSAGVAGPAGAEGRNRFQLCRSPRGFRSDCDLGNRDSRI